MPANLTPDYKAAEATYRKSRDPQQRLDALREMLRLIPKHKGTEHLQGEIKSKIKELTSELSGPRKGAARTGPATVIRPEGAAQVALVGPPNSGKSALHARLTGSHSVSAPYPFATQYPEPGMCPVHDVLIQLVDLPSISPQHPIPWIGNALQPADAALLVVDLGVPGCVEAVVELHSILEERRVFLTPHWPTDPGDPEPGEFDPFAVHLPCLVIATKADLIDDVGEELEVLLELSEHPYPSLIVSNETGEGLDQVGPWLFARLGIVRVYTKAPGNPVDRTQPFTVRHGATVLDVAELVHRDFHSFKSARVWGAGGFGGQQVGRDHVVQDGDVIELHM